MAFEGAGQSRRQWRRVNAERLPHRCLQLYTHDITTTLATAPPLEKHARRTTRSWEPHPTSTVPAVYFVVSAHCQTQPSMNARVRSQEAGA